LSAVVLLNKPPFFYIKTFARVKKLNVQYPTRNIQFPSKEIYVFRVFSVPCPEIFGFRGKKIYNYSDIKQTFCPEDAGLYYYE